MNLDELELFIQVAEQGSFAGAARVLNLDPSLVSRAIGRLERGLGFRLFQRTTRSFSLTEAGRQYLERMRPLLEEMARAREEALGSAAEIGGTVRLSVSNAYGQMRMMPLMKRFRARFPGLRLELIMTDANLDLVRERVDLAIRLAPMVEADVICSKLHATRYRVVAAPGYLQPVSGLSVPGDLADHDCVLLDLPGYRREWRFDDGRGREDRVPVSGSLVLTSPLAVRQAMLDGLGPALLADWMVDKDLEVGGCRDLFPNLNVTATSFETGAWLIYPSRDYLPHKLRLVIDFLRDCLG